MAELLDNTITGRSIPPRALSEKSFVDVAVIGNTFNRLQTVICDQSLSPIMYVEKAYNFNDPKTILFHTLLPTLKISVLIAQESPHFVFIDLNGMWPISYGDSAPPDLIGIIKFVGD